MPEPARPRAGRGAGGRAAGPARVAVVGGGFAGVLTAVHLLWRCRRGERVYLVERGGRLGSGVAYSTPNAAHLMNVRAANASAFADEPDHFERWLARLPPAERAAAGVETAAGTFVRRSVYGAYVQSLLRDALHRQGGAENLFIVDDSCDALRPAAGGGFELRTALGRDHAVDAAVLATGVTPPDPGGAAPGYAPNPWDPSAVAGLDRHAPVLLMGTGLTMVDVLLALRSGGFAGPVHAVSRRGLLPRAHADAPLWRGLRLGPDDRRSLPALTRAIRRESARAAAQGVDWRAVVDAARPRLADLWTGLTAEEQARFLRHLRPWWEVHRHRLAPPVSDTLAAEVAAGTLEVAAGRIEGTSWDGRRAEVRWRRRGGESRHRLEVQRVINCTGLGEDVTRSAEPLIRQLLDDGLASPDPHRLGLRATPVGKLVRADGGRADRLYAVGPLTRGTFWETTSIPDLREQAERAAVAALKEARSAARGGIGRRASAAAELQG